MAEEKTPPESSLVNGSVWVITPKAARTECPLALQGVMRKQERPSKRGQRPCGVLGSRPAVSGGELCGTSVFYTGL